MHKRQEFRDVALVDDALVEDALVVVKSRVVVPIRMMASSFKIFRGKKT